MCLPCRRAKGQAFLNHREDREGVKAIRTLQTPTRSIKSEVKITRESVGRLDFYSLGCSVSQPMQWLAN